MPSPVLLRALLALALLTVPAGGALAGFKVCNETDDGAFVAIGYRGGDAWVSEGWWQVAPGACATVIESDLDQSHYYWFADSERYDWGSERYMFCASPDAFTIVGDTDCAARGYVEQAFNEIVLEAGTTEHTLTLTAPAAAPGRTTRPGTGPLAPPPRFFPPLGTRG